MNKVARFGNPAIAAERLGKIVTGVPHRIGKSFEALHFSEEMFEGGMDPLLMVDHFVMTGPTFAPHLHAGISAVTVLFEDSSGQFLNRDSLGYNVALNAGDLYWLAAASGAAHEETPGEGARVHALQIFVNLPGRLKSCLARALHVEASNIPVIEGDGHRVRVVLGQSGDIAGEAGTPEEFTILDGFLSAGGRFSHPLADGWQAWLYVVAGEAVLRVGSRERVIPAGAATTIGAGDAVDISIGASESAHFALMAGHPIREQFVKAGPLVMSTAADVRRTLDDYAEGRFGRISG
jgi:redox-sensitive bicupin YhaK (pirin superfamily)